jgi:hypothetical protein
MQLTLVVPYLALLQVVGQIHLLGVVPSIWSFLGHRLGGTVLFFAVEGKKFA